MSKLTVTIFLTGCLILSHAVQSGAQTITTIAGCGIGDDSLATRAELVGPVGIAIDNAGNTYITDESSYRVRKVDAAGVITTFAGNGVPGNSGDGGPATAAHLGSIYSAAIDHNGNVYLVDNTNACIRKVNAAGIISTIAGSGMAGFSGDNGPAVAAVLNSPIDALIDTAGNIIFTDWGNNRVRKINTAGIITTIVGTGGVNNTGNNGPATASALGRPFRIAMDRAGNLYVAEVVYQYVCKVNTAGIINVIAGTGAYNVGIDGDGGPATAATMTSPCGLAVDTSGHLYFSDIGNGRVRKVDVNTGIISNYAANGLAGYSGDGGAATAGQISTPEGLACDSTGNLFICDADNNRIRKVNPGGIISTFAGQNALFGESYAATNAELCLPAGVATDGAGNVYIADELNNRIREINMGTGAITTVAGDGIAGYDDGFSGDGGPATAAHIYNPAGVAVDNAGNIYIADAGNNRVRKVDNAGNISTFAGNGTGNYFGNNIPATAAELYVPQGVAVDNAGNVYIADAANNRVRKVNSAGIISLVAGNGTQGFTGDGSPAIVARLNSPNSVAVDGAGNVYISDAGNYCIRKVDSSGIISTYAGIGGMFGNTGDGGDATAAKLGFTTGVATDSYGDVFITDGSYARVRMVTSYGAISGVAGNGTAGFSGDGGPALNAMLDFPTGVALDPTGNMYISDGQNFRVRKVHLSLSVPSISKNSSNNVSVYPNPATGIVNIGGADGCDIILYDAAGRAVMSRPNCAAKQSLDLRNLSSGVYILQVQNQRGERTMKKIVKE